MSIIHYRSPFSQYQIELLSDVTIPHKNLAKQFNISIAEVKRYRQGVLNIHLRGLNLDFDKIKTTVDWTLSDLQIARTLKISPTTVRRLKRRIEREQLGVGKTRNLHIVERILTSNDHASVLAQQLAMSTSAVRYIRRKHGVKSSAGRRRMTAADFPEIKDWKQSSNSIATTLGISWKIADRLRSEALNAKKTKPVVEEQLELPSMSINKLPPELRNVDWSENTSWLMIYLGMDKEQVLRFKSIARRQRRIPR
jgi:hypothetical protein